MKAAVADEHKDRPFFLGQFHAQRVTKLTPNPPVTRAMYDIG